MEPDEGEAVNELVVFAAITGVFTLVAGVLWVIEAVMHRNDLL